MNDFKNTRWLITGGTSGLGLALARILIDNNAKLAVVARDGDRLKKLFGPFEGRVLGIPADVSKKEDIYKISGQAVGFLGGLDYVVNGASSLGETPLRPLADTECESFTEVLETNLVGPFRLTKALLPTLILQKKGTVVNISSDAAVNAYPTWGSYGVSKAALDHLSHIWSEELKNHGIRFFSVDPGDMDTPMHAQAIPDADRGLLKKPELSARQLLDFLKAQGEEETAAWKRVSL